MVRVVRYQNQSVRLDFQAYMDKFPHQLQHDVEIEFSVLDLAFQNRV